MHSMTGFGRGEAHDQGVIWRVEISSVNRKQLELVVQLPRELNEIEASLRSFVASKISRGRVQIQVKLDRGAESSGRLSVDRVLAGQYVDSVRQLSRELGLEFHVNANDLVRWPGVFNIEQAETELESAQKSIFQATEQALEGFLQMRQTEGLNLKKDIEGRLNALVSMFEEAASFGPMVLEKYRAALHQRLVDAGLPIDLNDDRLVKEVGIFADRCDISEEITRALSHVDQFRQYMESGEPAGRSLDFLSQELFREINTMGSKANHAPLAQLVVRAKTELEKIREQVQNLE